MPENQQKSVVIDPSAGAGHRHVNITTSAINANIPTWKQVSDDGHNTFEHVIPTGSPAAGCANVLIPDYSGGGGGAYAPKGVRFDGNTNLVRDLLSGLTEGSTVSFSMRVRYDTSLNDQQKPQFINGDVFGFSAFVASEGDGGTTHPGLGLFVPPGIHQYRVEGTNNSLPAGPSDWIWLSGNIQTNEPDVPYNVTGLSAPGFISISEDAARKTVSSVYDNTTDTDVSGDFGGGITAEGTLEQTSETDYSDDSLTVNVRSPFFGKLFKDGVDITDSPGSPPGNGYTTSFATPFALPDGFMNGGGGDGGAIFAGEYADVWWAPGVLRTDFSPFDNSGAPTDPSTWPTAAVILTVTDNDPSTFASNALGTGGPLTVQKQIVTTGAATIGPVTLDGAVRGQSVIAVFDVSTFFDVSSDFETTISVDGQIQQIGDVDYSADTLSVWFAGSLELASTSPSG